MKFKKGDKVNYINPTQNWAEGYIIKEKPPIGYAIWVRDNQFWSEETHEYHNVALSDWYVLSLEDLL